MKNRLIQISQGDIEKAKPKVIPEKEKLGGVVLPDKKIMIELGIQSGNHIPMHLFFYSTDPRVVVSGNISLSVYGKLSIELNTIGLELGDKIEGEIDIVYNGGECVLPYSFTIGMAKDGENEYLFESLQDFRDFAEKDFETAVRVFSWKEFTVMPFMQNMTLRGQYSAYYSGVREDSGMREFLKATGYPLPEEKEEPKKNLCTRSVFTPIGISREETRRKNYTLLNVFLKTELMRSEGLTVHPGLREIREVVNRYPEDTLTLMFLSYVYYCSGETLKAKELLLRVQDEVQKERLEKKDVYCLFLYLASTLQEDAARIESTVNLIKKYWAEGCCTLLMALLLYRVNPEFSASYVKAGDFLRECWIRGLKHTPVLFETVKLWGNTAPDVGVLTGYELCAALYGIRKGLISERKLFELLGHELKNPEFLGLYTEVLKEGYYRFNNIELLHAIMNVFLKKQWIGSRFFFWYQEAVRREMTIPGLYEAYLRSVPDDFHGPFPGRLVEYFGYSEADRCPDEALLYSNVLAFSGSDERIMDLFRDRIEAFALKSMKDEVFNLRMKAIYATVLDKEHLNETNARYMLELFSLYEVESSLPDGERIIIHYPQLDKEEFYPLKGGRAILPVFSEDAIFVVENGRGERLYDGNLQKAPVFIDEELKSRSALYIDDSLLMKLHECDRIVREGVAKDRDLFLITDFIKDRRVVPFYRSRLYEALIDLSLSPAMQHIDCMEFLMEAEYKDFSKEYKLKFLTILIEHLNFNLAVDKAVTYGIEGLSDEYAVKLLENAVNMPLFQGNPVITSLCFRMFREEKASPVLMQYLAGYFKGSVKNMLAITRTLRKHHHNTRDLVYRTFLTAFFTDDRKDLDGLFDMYLQENVRDDLVIRAYLMMRSHEYFLNGKKMTENGIAILKKYYKSLPTIAAMALAKWYSEGELNDDNNEEILALLYRLLSKNIYLGCFSKFTNMKGVPFELLNRVYVEYRNPDAGKVLLSGSIQPERHVIHRAMTEVYPGVFVLSFILYKREWLEYSFRIFGKDGSTNEEEGGILSQEDETLQKTGRVADLITLEKRIRKKEDRETAEALRSMLVKEKMTRYLFENED